MIAAFSAADQLRRRPAPVNTSMGRTGSGICLCSEFDMRRSPHRLRTSPRDRHTERCRLNSAYEHFRRNTEQYLAARPCVQRPGKRKEVKRWVVVVDICPNEASITASPG